MTSFRFLASVLLLATLAFSSLHAGAAEKPISAGIQELSGKVFRVSESNGKAALTVFAGKDPIKDHMEIWQTFAAKPCNESVAVLNLAAGTSYVQPTNGKILSILECGMWSSSTAEYVIAFFDGKNLDAPQCASIVNLAKVADPSWLHGRVKSFDVKNVSDGEFNAVLTAGGGDAGHGWQSIIALRIRPDCLTTITHAELARSYYEPPRNCEGESLSYRFLDSRVIEITRQSVVCSPTEKTSAPVKKKIDLSVR